MRLGNFKALAGAQQIPIRPLTLIFGANSAGKSTIIHGLLLAHHASVTGELDVYRTTIGGESVDLGGFSQYVHRRDASRQVEWGAELDVSQLNDRLRELLMPVRKVSATLTIGIQLDDQGQPLHGTRPAVTSYEIDADGERLMRMSIRHDGVLRLDQLQTDHEVFRRLLRALVETSTTVQTITEEDYTSADAAIADLVPQLAFASDGLFPTVLSASQSSSPYRGPNREHRALVPVSRGRRREDLADAIRLFLPRTLSELIRGLGDALTSELARLRYLGPLRSYPPRHLAFAQYHDPNWFAGGGYIWDVLRRDDDVREYVNAWLSSPDRLQTPYELAVRELVGVDQLDAPLTEGIEELVDSGLEVEFTSDITDDERDRIYEGEPIPYIRDPEMEVSRLKDAISDSNIERLNELILLDRRSDTVVSHRDVGIGVSQVLPVLVGAYASQDQLVAIEQPEIHLHPALQAELGDIFIESALGGKRNTFILETHSEHLILRLMRRMRDTARDTLPESLPPVRPEDVTVLYVQTKGSTAVVKVLELDEEGQLLDPWPGGFFEEGFHERFD